MQNNRFKERNTKYFMFFSKKTRNFASDLSAKRVRVPHLSSLHIIMPLFSHVTSYMDEIGLLL